MIFPDKRTSSLILFLTISCGVFAQLREKVKKIGQVLLPNIFVN